MSVIWDYSDPLFAAVNLGTTHDNSFSGSTIVSPSSRVVYQSFFNPGHDGTLQSLEWYFEYGVAVTPSSSTGTAKWQFQSATGGAWVTLSSNFASTFHNAAARHMDSAASTLQVPLRIRYIVSCTGVVVFSKPANKSLAMRGIGKLST